MTTKCNYDRNENGLSLNYFSFSLQSLPQDGVEINARPFPVLVIPLVMRIKHHNSSISCILRRMAGEGWLLSAGHISVLPWAPPRSATAPGHGADLLDAGAPTPPGLGSEPTLLSHRTGATGQLFRTRPLQLSREKRLCKLPSTAQAQRRTMTRAPASERKRSESASWLDAPSCVHKTQTPLRASASPRVPCGRDRSLHEGFCEQ